jgi:hypothetical protein
MFDIMEWFPGILMAPRIGPNALLGIVLVLMVR